MSAGELITDLDRLGIRIEAHGDRLRYSPRSAVTPDLTRRMKAHKGELLAILRGDTPDASADDLLDDLARRGCLLRLDDAGRLVMDGIPPDLADAVARCEGELTRILSHEAALIAEAKPELQAALADDPEADHAGNPIEVIDPPDPCPKCGTLELWQSLAGNWRCLRCDPPTKARRLRERAARLKRTTQTMLDK